MFRLIFKKKNNKKYLLVFLNNKLFLTMFYIINKKYTFIYLLHLLYKYGFGIDLIKLNIK